jgi:hypothetical protein
MPDERRIYQRLTLSEPLDGWFGDFSVRLIDVSATGALVEYDEPIPDDSRALLRFYWRSREIEVLAETARTLERRSGLKFLEENEELRQAIAASAKELLLALDANARGERAGNVVGEETITSAWRRPLSGFVRWIYDGAQWHSELAGDASQPADGFTIAAAETPEQVELLRQTYESGDAEARRLTRMLAELSVAAAI